MPIDTIIGLIDAEIGTRTSNKFGIKLGGALHKELMRVGKIQWRTFTMEGTGLFPIDLPAYLHDNWGYAATVDWGLDDYEFKVGVPD